MTKHTDTLCNFCKEHGLNESNGCGCWDRDNHTDTHTEHEFVDGKCIDCGKNPIEILDQIADSNHTNTDELREEFHDKWNYLFQQWSIYGTLDKDDVENELWKLITAYTTNRERALLDELEEATKYQRGMHDSDVLWNLDEFIKSKRELQNQTSKTERS